MNQAIVKPLRDFKALSTCLLLALIACSCASNPASSGPVGPRLDPAPLPAYIPGTTFVYSDGTWETVIDATPGMVTWQDHRNYLFSGSPDFTYRPSQWEGQNRSITRQFGPRTDLYTRSATRVWPLRTGNFANYSESGTWTENDGTQSSYRTDWSCAVAGTERVAVLAGDFDTFKIVCRRYYVSSSKSRSQLREEKTWNYAPEVGHYVLAATKYYYDKQPRRRELLAVLPPLGGFPAGARRQLERSFQQALDRKKSGQAVRWSSAELGASVETIPTKTFKTEAGSYSRRYVQKLILPDSRRTYYGMAVRNPDGLWTIPRR